MFMMVMMMIVIMIVDIWHDDDADAHPGVMYLRGLCVCSVA